MNAKLEAVLELAKLYNYEPEHAHQVECIAGTLFMELQHLHNLTRADRKLLEYAAILHEIGNHVSSRGHHRHTLMMILQEPLTVFTREEKAIIANVARYHRKALPTPEHTAFGVLSEESRRKVQALAAILRVADALDRSHQALVKEMSTFVTDHAVTFVIPSDRDLPTEQAALERKRDLFEQVFQREARLEVLRPRLAAGQPPEVELAGIT